MNTPDQFSIILMIVYDDDDDCVMIEIVAYYTIKWFDYLKNFHLKHVISRLIDFFKKSYFISIVLLSFLFLFLTSNHHHHHQHLILVKIYSITMIINKQEQRQQIVRKNGS